MSSKAMIKRRGKKNMPAPRATLDRQAAIKRSLLKRDVHILCIRMKKLQLTEHVVSESEKCKARTDSVFNFDKMQDILSKIKTEKLDTNGQMDLNTTTKQFVRQQLVLNTDKEKMDESNGLKPGSSKITKSRAHKLQKSKSAGAPVGLCRSKAMTAIDLETEKQRRVKKMMTVGEKYAQKKKDKDMAQRKGEMREQVKEQRMRAKDDYINAKRDQGSSKHWRTDRYDEMDDVDDSDIDVTGPSTLGKNTGEILV